MVALFSMNCAALPSQIGNFQESAHAALYSSFDSYILYLAICRKPSYCTQMPQTVMSAELHNSDCS